MSEFSLITPQYGQKASCLHLPPMVNDCLMRHPCRWKSDNRNSLSVPTRHSGGTTAVNRAAPVLAKEDRAVGRYLSQPSRVYRGTQSTVVVNWSGEHSTRRPSSRRIGSQWLVITSGRSDSDAAARVQSALRCQCPFWRVWFQPPILGGCTSRAGPNRYLQQRFHTSWGGCLPLSPLWVGLLHGEACSSPALLLPASLETMSVDSCSLRVVFGFRLVHFLA